MGWNIENRKISPTFYCLLMVIIAAASQAALAENLGLTIPTTKSSSYGTTEQLRPETIGLLDSMENSDEIGVLSSALRKLHDGDILVLAVHSNPNVFAIGDKTISWRRFWATFGIDMPPQLGIVIIGGCMASKVNGEYIPATEKQMQTLRDNISCNALFAPKAAINPIVAGIDTATLLQSIKNGKKLSEIDLGGKWNYVSSPDVDKAYYRWTAACTDISGYKVGELMVTNVTGESSIIPLGQKRLVGAGSFLVEKEDCSVTLKFNDNEISGKMINNAAILKNSRKGTVIKAILTQDLERLHVILNQTMSEGMIITSRGSLR